MFLLRGGVGIVMHGDLHALGTVSTVVFCLNFGGWKSAHPEIAFFKLYFNTCDKTIANILFIVAVK